MTLSRLSVMGARVDAGSVREMDEEILRLAASPGTSRVCFANVHMVVESWRMAPLRQAMERADLVCPDGMPVALLLRREIRGQQRVEGMSALPRLLERAAREGVAVGFFGSTVEVQEALVAKIRRELPDLQVNLSRSPPFGNQDETDWRGEIAAIRQSKARLVFVALGCPRQEIWMDQLRDVDACFLGVGNAFEIWLGRQKRAPGWARRLCLEWAFRLIQEPRRLAGRYLRTNVQFLMALPGWLWRARRISNSREP